MYACGVSETLITQQICLFVNMTARGYIKFALILSSVFVLCKLAASYLVFCNFSREKLNTFSTLTSAD